MSESLTITQKLWHEIDAKVDEVMPLAKKIKELSAREMGQWESPEGKTLTLAKLEAEKNKVAGVGRGLAIAIQLLTSPAFATPDDVVKHAQKRWKAAQSGESIETPGIRGSGQGPSAATAREPEPEPSPPSEATTPSEPDAPAATPTPGTPDLAAALIESVKKPKRRAAPAPTPEETIAAEEKLDFDPDVAGPNVKMSVNEALRRAEEKRKKALLDGESGSLEPGHGEHSAEEIAAMLNGLDADQ